MSISRILVPVLVACLAQAAAADVFVVDPAGGPGGPLLQAALDAAQPGDILLLKPGDYATGTPAHVSGKGLAIVGDPDENPVILPALLADGVPAGGTLVVDGLLIEPPDQGPWDFLFRLTGAGTLWVQDCEARGMHAWPDVEALQSGPAMLAGQPGLVVAGTGSAVVSRSTFSGGRGLDATTGPLGEVFAATAGGNAVAAQVSRIALVSSQGHGGDGGSGAWSLPFQPNGGAGLAAFGGWALVLGGDWRGGDERDAVPATTRPGAGASFAFESAALRDVLLEAGVVHGDGVPVADLESFASVVSNWSAPARLLDVPSPLRELAASEVRIQGLVGDVAWLFVSLAPGSLGLPANQGWWLVDAGTLPAAAYLGFVSDPMGQLTLALTVPPLPPGEDGVVLFVQLAVLDALGEPLLGTASATAWISAAL